MNRVRAHVQELMKYPGLDEETMEVTISTAGMSDEVLRRVASLEPGDVVRYNRIISIPLDADPDGFETIEKGGLCQITEVSTRRENSPIVWVEFIAENSISCGEMRSLYEN